MIEDFYPTPAPLIRKMCSGIKFREVRSILEPSAGKGDICDEVVKQVNNASNHGRAEIDVIEINPTLQATLRGKGHNLVHDDFLTFRSVRSYDLIIANFPFSHGDEHLLHAIELVRQNGGQLVCLVNAETIRNPHTQKRDMLRRWLDDCGADIEYLDGEFTNAERRTDVEVALIRVTCKRPAGNSVIFEDMKKAETFQRSYEIPNGLVEKDFVSAMVSRFDMEAKVGVRLIDEYHSLKPYIQNALPTKDESDNYGRPIIELKVGDREYSGTTAAHQINNYLDKLRRKYWTVLINDPRYTGQYTTNIREDLNRKLDELCRCDFSRFNIESLARDLAIQLNKGVEKAILDLFDKLSRGHAWGKEFDEGNIHYYNGWKTNKVWKVNHKVIIPLHGAFSYNNTFDYRAYENLADMAKVFDFLSTDKCCERLLTGIHQRRSDIYAGNVIDLRYFDIKLYKKGTCHIRFKDKALLDKFNIFASQRKGWLPPAYGKKTYDEMTADELAVIDTFQGREAYDMVMKDPDYYLVEDAAGLLGSGTGGD
ncbi:hypothetical protein BH10ACI2_BH10ACI2_00390 [soil metagenome]